MVEESAGQTTGILFKPFRAASMDLPNRLVMPPMVCFGWAGPDGLFNGQHARHYQARAEGGVGLVIIEGTAVMPESRLRLGGAGLWSDSQIPGLAEVVRRCHAAGAKVMIQLYHGGRLTDPAVTGGQDMLAPLSLGKGSRRTRAATREEFAAIAAAFAAAAERALVAGCDGVELHGAHGYLLCQMASPTANLREDEYGGSLEGRLLLACQIIRQIRAGQAQHLVIGYRMGCNEPTYQDGVAIAQLLERAGCDILHVSGLGGGEPVQAPPGYPFNFIVYGGSLVHQAVKIPVIAVNDIRTPERAAWLLDHNQADLVALGRPLLNNPNYVREAQKGLAGYTCQACKPCHWFAQADTCPAQTVSVQP